MCIVVIGNRKMPVFVASHINIVAKPINLQNTGHQTFVSISSKLYESSSEALYILCETNLEYSMNSSIFSRGIIFGGVYLPSSTSFYMKNLRLFASHSSLESFGNSYVFDWLYFIQFLIFYSQSITIFFLAQCLKLFHHRQVSLSQTFN